MGNSLGKKKLTFRTGPWSLSRIMKIFRPGVGPLRTKSSCPKTSKRQGSARWTWSDCQRVIFPTVPERRHCCVRLGSLFAFLGRGAIGTGFGNTGRGLPRFWLSIFTGARGLHLGTIIANGCDGLEALGGGVTYGHGRSLEALPKKTFLALLFKPYVGFNSFKARFLAEFSEFLTKINNLWLNVSVLTVEISVWVHFNICLSNFTGFSNVSVRSWKWRRLQLFLSWH